MKNWFKSLLAAAFLLAAPVAHAADSNVVSLTAAASVVGTDLWYCGQSVGTVDKKCSSAQIAAYVYGLMSGDATASGAGALTLKNTGPGATGPLGSATVAPIVTIDAQGRVTGFTSATITPAIGSITGLGAGCATFLATPTSANLATCLTDETGTGANVFANGPTLIAPVLGTPASGNLANTTGFPLANLSGVGTGVLGAAANNLSAAGGMTTTIGSGSLAMSVSAISSGSCTAAQTVTVTNTATTDVVLVGFNGDPTGVTGFAPTTNGMLTIIAYPTLNTVNIKECNNTLSSVTPGAHTLNVRVVR